MPAEGGTKYMIIEKIFQTDKQILDWLLDPDNLEALAIRYPPEKYSAGINLVNKQIIITEKNPKEVKNAKEKNY